MAALRAPSFQASLPPFRSSVPNNSPRAFRLSFSLRNGGVKPFRAATTSLLRRSPSKPLRVVKLAASGDAEATETEQAQEPQIEESLDSDLGSSESSSSDESESEVSDDAADHVEEKPTSPVIASLQLYKEALANEDESKIAELESFFKALEDEKTSLERKYLILSEEASAERDRVLRISADFDNFRKRTERERSSLVTNAKGEVIESLLPVLDNFERAKAQIKIETEGEEKVNNSYQSISKQFNEILTSLGVVPVETTGNPFDPLLHEAIMRDDSDEFEEGIILQEFRRGFRIGERLLRPSMVKVSAGPGPAKPEQVAEEEGQNGNDGVEESNQEADSA